MNTELNYTRTLSRDSKLRSSNWNQTCTTHFLSTTNCKQRKHKSLRSMPYWPRSIRLSKLLWLRTLLWTTLMLRTLARSSSSLSIKVSKSLKKCSNSRMSALFSSTNWMSTKTPWPSTRLSQLNWEISSLKSPRSRSTLKTRWSS